MRFSPTTCLGVVTIFLVVTEETIARVCFGSWFEGIDQVREQWWQEWEVAGHAVSSREAWGHVWMLVLSWVSCDPPVYSA